MNYEIRCPNNHLLRVADAHLGKVIRCPNCKTTMLVEAPAAPVPIATFKVAGVADEQPPICLAFERLPSEQREAAASPFRLLLTQLGIICHFIKFLCFLASPLVLLVAVVLAYLAARLRSPELGSYRNELALVFVGLLGFTPLLGMLGSLLCIFVPSKPGGRALIVASFFLDAIGLVLGAASPLINTSSVGSAAGSIRLGAGPETAVNIVPLAAFIIGLILVLAAWMSFLMFVQTIFKHYHDSILARETQLSLTFSVVVLAGTPFFFAFGCWLAIHVEEITNWMVSATIFAGVLLTWIIACCKLLIRVLVVVSGAKNFLVD